MSLIFLTCNQVRDYHQDIINYSGGCYGESQNMTLEAVLGRIENNQNYNKVDDVFQIAALYALAIAQGHPFIDGNKRTALVSMIVFLNLNGKSVDVSQKEIEDLMVEIADKKIEISELCQWLESNS